MNNDGPQGYEREFTTVINCRSQIRIGLSTEKGELTSSRVTVSVEIPPRYVRLVGEMARERNQSFEEYDDWDNKSSTWGVNPEDRHVIGLMG
ncbi:hypothetical protein [Haloquadratum walsbyi]|jgi:hypothetical protein|uniref:Uncharacterized protein n=1 Tax=Haloquadratum walsbyi J07HQW2 TaxID=1238425 RepID=U1NGU4_9EURY|nr:hypothetical protein [Haloquadratum walsbyi]ERG96073.1 MAG: hypothetical protein J07HQW2_02540 [Haloquadratum walsbyi J07HQW2]